MPVFGFRPLRFPSNQIRAYKRLSTSLTAPDYYSSCGDVDRHRNLFVFRESSALFLPLLSHGIAVPSTYILSSLSGLVSQA